jgi:hypothetical protein
MSAIRRFVMMASMLAFLSTAWTAHAGTYLITVVDAKLTAKKDKYKRWDTGLGAMTRPDVYVILEVAGQRWKTPVRKNTITPKWNVSWKLTLTGKERLYVKVYDKDFAGDDLAGKGSSLLQPSVSMAFGKVESLRLKIERLDKPVVRKAAPKKAPAVRKAVKVAPVKAAPVKAAPKKAVPVRTEPAKAVPVRAEPAKAVPAKPAAPVKAAPVKAAPKKAAPAKAAPKKAAPAKRAAVKKAAPAKVAPKKAAPAKKAAKKAAPASRPAKK